MIGRLDWRRFLLALSPLLLVVGCEKPPEVLEPLQQPSGLQAAPPRTSGAVPTQRPGQRVFEERGSGPAGPPAIVSGAGPAAQGGDVTLNFADTDIREVVRTILGTTLKLNYTIDPNVHGTATLESSTPMSPNELLHALEAMLNRNGATIVVRNGIYSVVPVAVAGGINSVAGPDTLGGGSEVVNLRFAVAKDLAKTLEPFITEGGKVAPDPARNALIVSGEAASRETLVRLIQALDVDVMAKQSFALFPLGSQDLTKTTAELEKALRAEADGPLADVVRVVPLEGANAILVSSLQPRYVDAARRFFRLTSRAENATARTWHVYYVKNGQSADLENLLQRAFTPGSVTGTNPPGAIAPGGTPQSIGAPLFEAGGFGGAGRGIGATGAGAGGFGTAGAGAPQQQGRANPPPPPPPPGIAALSSATPSETADRIRIIANQHNNALMIYATPDEYSMIEGMLRKIDIVPLQVLIDATIAEVTLNDALQYGTQFFLTADRFAFTLGSQPSLPTTFAGFAVTRSPNFIIKALADVSQVRVLSAPQVLVMDNQPAHLQVGQEVPILTGTATSTLTTGAPIVNSIDYHPTGVIMQVTPQVNTDGLVTLDIAQEVSDVAPPAPNTATGSPTFDDRLVRTRLAVQDGQTIGVAGLIRDTVQEENSGFPWIKDIPLIGTLVSTQNNTRMRTELLVLMTPHVIHDQRNARTLTDDLRRKLNNAAIVPQAVQHKPASGSPNPNGL